MSCSRDACAEPPATSLSSSSPTGWPSVSLTSLNGRDRGRARQADRCVWRAARPFRAARGTACGSAVGQRVVARHVGDLFLGGLPFGDVLVGRDPAAALHRLIDHAKRTAAAAHRLGHGPPALRPPPPLAKNSSGSPSHSPAAFASAARQSAAALQRHAGPVHEFDVALVEQAGCGRPHRTCKAPATCF